MNKEKFIEKLLFEHHGLRYFARQKDTYIQEFEDTKKTIVKAMKYHNWTMFLYGVIMGIFIILVTQFL